MPKKPTKKIKIKPRERSGGQRTSYPGKVSKSISMTLIPAGHARMAACRQRQLEHNWKGMNRLPSVGDIVDGLLDKYGDDLILPTPTANIASKK